MSVNFNDYMPQIWNTLKAAIGNEYGVAGLMGNLYAESGCTPYACQPSRPYSTCMTYIGKVDRHEISETGFVHHGCSSTGGVAQGQGGFGLAQWTYYTRKQSLYDYWLTQGGSIGDLGMQLRYLIIELQTNFSDVWNVLVNAQSVKEASDYVLHHFEKPDDQSSAVENVREGYGTDIYNQYAGTTPTPVPTPTPPPDPPNPEPQPPLKLPIRHKMPIWLYPILRR
jgi:hypothetical protein